MKYDQWMGVAAREYELLFALLHSLKLEDWDRLTGCAPWTVRDIVAHLDGAACANASIREQLRQQRAGKAVQAGRERMVAVNAVQIAERAALPASVLLADLEAHAAHGLKARSGLPGPLRRIRLPLPAPLGWASLGYLQGAIYTRDAWMHRIDISRAVNRAPELSAEHDGAIVADLVESWAGTAPATLNLTGPAGARCAAGSGPPVDAVDFARALSGRGSVPGIKAVPELF